jgi:hypothetical protein
LPIGKQLNPLNENSFRGFWNRQWWREPAKFVTHGRQTLVFVSKRTAAFK